MTYDQFLEHLAKKGIPADQYIRRVSLLFFCADLADSLSTEIESMMAPHGCLSGDIKRHIKKMKFHASAMIKHSDASLTSKGQEDFAIDGDTFKDLAYEWARLNK